jgi:preprotein translocase subunit SecG
MDVFMQTVIIVIHLMLVTGLIGVVLLQRSEGGGLGMGSGGGGGFLSSRGTGNLLTRTTAILAGLFFVTSLALSIIASMGRQPTSILTPTGTPAVPGAPAPAGQPGQPGRGVLDTLRGPDQPAAPAAPSGPQVPQSQ